MYIMILNLWLREHLRRGKWEDYKHENTRKITVKVPSRNNCINKSRTITISTEMLIWKGKFYEVPSSEELGRR